MLIRKYLKLKRIRCVINPTQIFINHKNEWTYQNFNYPALLFVGNNGPLISYYHTGKRLDNDNDDFRAKKRLLKLI